MRAVRVEQFGIDNLKVMDLPDPVPGVGEVLVATEAATINPADATVVTGAAAPRFPPERSARTSPAGTWSARSAPVATVSIRP